VTGADATVAAAFGTFDGTLESVSVGSGAASARSLVLSQGAHCQQVFDELAASTSFAQYNQSLQVNGPILTVFSEDYQSLIHTLG